MRILGALVLTIALGAASEARADLDIDRWIARPGVRMVIVEVSASWCKPCVEAAPKWRALAQKKRAEGVRFILITTQDAKGCLSPMIEADEQVCDESGHIAELFGANPLPAAYVWSWQGKMLGKKLSFEDVDHAIDGWISATPRVSVEVSSVDRGGPRSDALRDLIRGELRAADKLIVVASREEQARLDAVKAESLKARYDEHAQCEIGKELSANAILDARLAADRLSLSLLSAERGCLVAAASAPWNGKKPEASVSEAVSALFSRLAPKAELPWAERATAAAPATPASPVAASPVAASPVAADGARVLQREPKLLVVQAVRNPNAEKGDSLARLNWAQKHALAAARALAVETLTSPPYGLDRAAAEAMAEDAKAEISMTADGSVMIALRVMLP